MEVKKALFKNFLASGWGKISTVLFRLIQIPILLSFLGIENYGRWLVLYTLPSWLSLANLGFGSVAGNDISIAIGKRDFNAARATYSSTFRVVTYIFFAGVILIIPVAYFIPWEKLLKLPVTHHAEIMRVLIWFALSTLLSFFDEIFQARFRAARKAHVYILLYSFRPWLELLAMIVVLQFTTRLDHLALAVLCSTIIFVIATQWLSYRAMPELSYNSSHVQKGQLRNLFRKGLAFQAFPLGNALIFQGNILVVQLLLGPVAVAIFGSVRTLVRSINQMLELINQVMWPELSILFGTGDLQKAARLHRIGVVLSIGIALIFVLVLGLFGQKLFSVWTGGAFVLSRTLLFLFLLPIPFNSLWFTSSVIHMASNRHEGLAVRYLIAMCLAVIGCGILAWLFGIEGAAVSTVIADLILIPYVFRVSLA
ncbi:MAG: lipopolysaccharide biosynthesis protein, partial [Chitinophagaceae bacterium]